MGHSGSDLRRLASLILTLVLRRWLEITLELARRSGVSFQPSLTPVDDYAVTQVMGCREAAHSTLMERIGLMGWSPRWRTRPATFPQLRAGAPLFLLGEVLGGLPRQLPEHRTSPLDALTTGTTDPGREAWRHAARALMQGTHALTTAVSRPWVEDPGPAGSVIADCAAAVEALVVLDERLAEVGLLARHGPGVSPPMPSAEARMRLSHCGHVAMCNATCDQVDLAVAHVPEVDQSVCIVRQPSDLIHAQRRLASLVRPLRPAWPASALERTPHINLATAKNVLFGQLDLCSGMERLCRLAPGEHRLESLFGDYGDGLRQLLPNMRRLAELRPVEGRPLVVWQQQEVTLGMRLLAHRPDGLDAHQVQALGVATHLAVSEFASTFRKEIRARGSNITSTRLDDETQFRADIRDTPLDRYLAALSRIEPPALDGPEHRSRDRAALGYTLRRTPSPDIRAVSPFVQHANRSRGPARNALSR